MGARSSLLGILSGLLLFSTFLASARFAHAATEAYPLRIKIISAETRSLNTETPVPIDCDMTNFSAYCNNSKNPTSQSIMVVQDEQGKGYRISCTIDSRKSKCAPLTVGNTFEARKDKHGITILYRNNKGKETKESYQLIASVSLPPPSAVASAQLPASAAPQNSLAPATAPARPVASAPAAAQSVPPAAPPPGWVRVTPSPKPLESAPSGASNKIRCSFMSTPAGAEITLDGKYVGNTPSEIGVSAGTHVVVLSMPGFADWKRDLAVAADSVVNVEATLQKAP
jgi:hypothetical protein